jgi:hypothetical protein
VKVALTFLIAIIGWLLFRAETIQSAWAMFASMFVLDGVGDLSLKVLDLRQINYGCFVLALLLTWGSPNSQELESRNTWWLGPLATIVFAGAVTQIFFKTQIPFIYFQF